MRYSIGGGFTGSEFLDFLIAGIILGAVAQGVISALGGKMPGPGMIIAGVAGGIVAVIIFVFKSGMNY